MVRLTAQLINMSAQKHNPVRDWELDLRGYRIPVLENLGATLDQFDTIDLTDNDIRKLDKFPLLKRLKTIMLSNNRIVRIAEGLHETLPSLETLVLTNNNIKELSDIDVLSTISTLKFLSLLGNPLVSRKNYRLYIIHKIPSLRVLDFCRVRLREREAANKMFKKKKAQQPQIPAEENGVRSKTFVPGDKLPPSRMVPTGPSKEEVAAIRKAISKASTLEEIERLNQMLQSRQIPRDDIVPGNTLSKGSTRREEFEEEEEDDEDDEDEDGKPMEASHYSEEAEEMEDD